MFNLGMIVFIHTANRAYCIIVPTKEKAINSICFIIDRA